MPAIYDGLQFKTQLEARWAAFFDLADWEWRVNPEPVGDWAPDFRVTFPCGHSECGPTHTLLVAVVPVTSREIIAKHHSAGHIYGVGNGQGERSLAADAGAAFGATPSATYWEFSHGAGGGIFDVRWFVPDADSLWIKAGSLVK